MRSLYPNSAHSLPKKCAFSTQILRKIFLECVCKMLIIYNINYAKNDIQIRYYFKIIIR